ncbi:hypothetical protein CXG81DRAFT_27525 [Caulochytrium protostelioides]|uniref:Uncharacterized protein n=1 Tax=Caulochytrium protostelioides TaxID=1555241 RepID=A0A4P9X3Y4_9FUNG|nr:hypothetical protein CXG81DRAFT_27525 [Caulochytrium protostelioides]|eukprot:RKO99731.1 hypothetical protein CXG81DRAFT_27525 [Caulochytrium protostelioides]
MAMPKPHSAPGARPAYAWTAHRQAGLRFARQLEAVWTHGGLLAVQLYAGAALLSLCMVSPAYWRDSGAADGDGAGGGVCGAVLAMRGIMTALAHVALLAACARVGPQAPWPAARRARAQEEDGPSHGRRPLSQNFRAEHSEAVDVGVRWIALALMVASFVCDCLLSRPVAALQNHAPIEVTVMAPLWAVRGVTGLLASLLILAREWSWQPGGPTSWT